MRSGGLAWRLRVASAGEARARESMRIITACPHRCRWDTLATAGLNLTTHIFVATNASNYKSFEFWALGKGIPISHIVNSGASTALGDAR